MGEEEDDEKMRIKKNNVITYERTFIFSQF